MFCSRSIGFTEASFKASSEGEQRGIYLEKTNKSQLDSTTKKEDSERFEFIEERSPK